MPRPRPVLGLWLTGSLKLARWAVPAGGLNLPRPSPFTRAGPNLCKLLMGPAAGGGSEWRLGAVAASAHLARDRPTDPRLLPNGAYANGWVRCGSLSQRNAHPSAAPSAKRARSPSGGRNGSHRDAAASPARGAQQRPPFVEFGRPVEILPV